MKSTGIVRRIDELGRFVLPAEIRKAFDIHLGDQIEIHTDNESIVLQKYNPHCLFCGSSEEIRLFGERRICKACLEKLKQL